MLISLTIFGLVLSLVPKALVLVFCFILYRQLALPSLPYLAATSLIWLLFLPASFYVVIPWIKGLEHDSRTGASAASYLTAAGLVLGSITTFLVILLILSEMAHFIDAHRPDIHSKLLTWLTSVRNHVKLLGISLVVLTLIPDLLLLSFSAGHYVFTAD